ncbi:unnamed protein product [Trifolium pratense]|uniref:Uncharacterized protein n=1 Tax=Trifolium pratense TaxID=57577 RepID=A0ACB0LLX1_TRIPR|nr:unnamed protein product [Trifolium pratense]
MEVPQDIGFEIFSWLPAKSICKFKSTCNTFSKFSEETLFRKKQTQNLFGRDDTCLFIQSDEVSQRYIPKRIELYSLPKHQESSGAPNNVLSFLSKNTTSVIASSNGLVLCHNINDPLKVFICNPITKSWSFIPIPESLQINNNFANAKLMLHCSLDDYKVYFLFENTMEWNPTYTCSVYHGKEGVWKTMERCFLPGGRDMKFDMPVFYNGALHFISNSGEYYERPSPFYKPYIMSYNLENGISTMFRLPREAIRDCHRPCNNMGIFNWGKASNSNGSICLVKLRKSTFTVWYLRDYESCSWEKVFKMRVRAMGLKEKDLDVTSFTVVNGNLLVFATNERVYSCGLDDKRFMVIEEICQHNCGFNPHFISYLDTYRSCGINAKTMPC